MMRRPGRDGGEPASLDGAREADGAPAGREAPAGVLDEVWRAQRAVERLAGRWRPDLGPAERARLTRELVLELGVGSAELVRELGGPDDGHGPPVASNVRVALAGLAMTLLSSR
jgi:hypothetical protein